MLLLACGGVLLVLFASTLFGGSGEERQPETSASETLTNAQFVEQTEQKLQNILNGISGVERCEVMITLESGIEYRYATDESDSTRQNGNTAGDSVKSESSRDTETKIARVNDKTTGESADRHRGVSGYKRGGGHLRGEQYVHGKTVDHRDSVHGPGNQNKPSMRHYERIGVTMKAFKKQIMLIAVCAVICVSVFVSWKLNQPDNADDAMDKLTSAQQGEDDGKVLGEAEFVNSTSEYFSSARLNRQETRDEAVRILNEIIANESSTEEDRAVAQEKLLALSDAADAEGRIEKPRQGQGLFRVRRHDRRRVGQRRRAVGGPGRGRRHRHQGYRRGGNRADGRERQDYREQIAGRAHAGPPAGFTEIVIDSAGQEAPDKSFLPCEYNWGGNTGAYCLCCRPKRLSAAAGVYARLRLAAMSAAAPAALHSAAITAAASGASPVGGFGLSSKTRALFRCAQFRARRRSRRPW